jgi:hypothetical protein
MRLTERATDTSLCWTEPQRASVDTQLEDPLAFNALESQVAGLLWPGFTRHTSEPAYYVMVCYGLLIAETVAQQNGIVASDDTIRTLFHGWERLWAMAVCVAQDGDLSREKGMRGRAGAEAAFLAGAPTLDYRLLARRRDLSALGAYLTSLRDHGFVRPDRLRLTPLGWDLAQWMWDEPGAGREDFEPVLVSLLRPGNAVIPKKIASTTLLQMGKRGSLSAIAARPSLVQLLSRRLFDEADPRFLVLREMTAVLVAATQKGTTDPRTMFEEVVRSPGTSSALRDIATLALVFGDLAITLRTIFDRMYQTVLAAGFASDWGACVRAAIPQGFADVLRVHIDNWRRFLPAEAMLQKMAYGQKFNQVVKRLNAQNAYHIFESVLHLHVQMQRVRGKGSWIDRKGEVVYLRHAGYETWALEGGEWAPGYRVAMMRQLLRDMGRLT